MMTNEQVPVVILAGGNGTTLGGGERRSKTMVDVCGRPLLDHIITYYAKFGFRKFLISAGQGIEMIVAYLAVPEVARRFDALSISTEVVDTGISANTGARLARLRSRLLGSGQFMLTYGDVITDIPLDRLIQFHASHGKDASLAAVHAPTRFRILGLNDVSDDVLGFADKPILCKDYISGGYYVLSERVLNLPVLSEAFSCSFEFNVLQDLVAQGQVKAFRHEGYWQSLDTERDLNKLEQYVQAASG